MIEFYRCVGVKFLLQMYTESQVHRGRDDPLIRVFFSMLS